MPIDSLYLSNLTPQASAYKHEEQFPTHGKMKDAILAYSAEFLQDKLEGKRSRANQSDLIFVRWPTGPHDHQKPRGRQPRNQGNPASQEQASNPKTPQQREPEPSPINLEYENYFTDVVAIEAAGAETWADTRQPSSILSMIHLSSCPFLFEPD